LANRKSKCITSGSLYSRVQKVSVLKTALLAVCAILVGRGVLTIMAPPGFFMNLRGAGMFATGGTAAGLILLK